MSFFKTAAILLIAAIANPLCCCHAVASQSADADSVTYHNCCEFSKDATNEGEQTQHNPDNCQHMADRDAQISQTADSGESLVKSIYPLAAEIPAFLEISELELEAKSYIEPSSESDHIPDTPRTRVYCVYLL